MPTKQDYYETLGVERGATGDEIKRAYRRLAFQYHPDHNPEDGSGEKFKQVNEAYEILSDPQKRSNYDRFGHAGTEGAFGRGFEDFGFGGLGDIFDTFFGGATATRQSPQRGADLQYRLNLTFEEAAFGCEKEVAISRTENCSLCGGTASKPGSQPSRCPACNGNGQVHRVHQSLFGRFTNTTTCSQCRGEGRIITEPCPQCRGSGREKQRRTIAVKVPAGVTENSRIRLSGEGEAGTRGGPSGSLYITLVVKPHSLFAREDDDILYELPLNFAQAALGTEINVPTLEDDHKLKIPAGSQTGDVLKLKDQGIPHLRRRGRGDQLVRLFVATPEKLTKKQRQLLEELGDSFGDNSKPLSGKWKGLFRRESN